ncbi:hypothetical protein [Pseudomonas anguilliseptica]|uniref:Uncharacterized protein n=1 Tax=Pseudomonas anguilliseptica TaxID=53406 RepID=A0A1H4ZYT8_PSEAG|nr:hypothetical protein [Pseudomonas anguilliseptica]SED34641.1 hypothetical protein SAMN05421553_2495 [Pseudomonas anguilliseptica]
MKVALAFVPPGGGETDYSLEIEMPAIPQQGDYIAVNRGDEPRVESFIVRRVHWGFQVNDDGGTGRTTTICVECEFADCEFATDNHKRAVDMYQNRTGKRLTFDVSVY